MAVKAYIKNPKSGTEGQPEYLAVPLRNEPLSPTKARVTALERQEYNISQANNTTYASLTEAIAAVSDDKYKAKGLVLTFNTGTEWVSKRYNGEDSSGFSDELNWVDVGASGGGSSEHTLDLSPLFDEEGSPVATVSDEFLAEVKKAYDNKYSNAIYPILGGASIPIILLQEAEGYYNIILNYTSNTGRDMVFNMDVILIGVSEKRAMLANNKQSFINEGSGTKALTDNGKYIEFATPVKVENGGSGTVTKQLNPNTYYEFGECTSLTITLASEISGIRNEYMFEFVSGSTATQLADIPNIKWQNGEKLIPEANNTYRVSIINNCATYIKFPNS